MVLTYLLKYNILHISLLFHYIAFTRFKKFPLCEFTHRLTYKSVNSLRTWISHIKKNQNKKLKDINSSSKKSIIHSLFGSTRTMSFFS